MSQDETVRVKETIRGRDPGQSPNLIPKFFISQSLNDLLVSKLITSRRIVMKERAREIMFRLW